MLKKADKNGIQVECWYPLGGAQSQGLLLRDPVIKKIAEAHGKSPAQIILRWHIQEGFSVIPVATYPDYIKENIQIFDFALTDNEMQQIRSLNKEQRIFNASMEDVKRMIWGSIVLTYCLFFRMGKQLRVLRMLFFVDIGAPICNLCMDWHIPLP